MAWANNEGAPYYRPVAPEVPVAPREPQGERLGGNLLTAMTQAALARERAQIEQEQNLRSADLAAQTLELKKQDLKQDYELKKILYGSYQTNAEANQTRATSALERITGEATRRQEVNDELIATNDKIKSEPEYKFISDQSNLDKDPVGYWANYRRFSENHASDVMSIAPDIIKQVKPLVDQQKIPFREGARWVPGGEMEIDGKTKTVPGHFENSGAEVRDVTVWQLAERYKDAKPGPERDQILHGLMAAGQQKIATSIEKFHKKDSVEGERAMTRKKNVFSVSDKAQKILDAGEKTDFSHGKDVTPEIFTEKYKKGGAMGVDYNGSGNPDYVDPNEEARLRLESEQTIPIEPDDISTPTSSAKPAGFTPTPTDVTLQQARNALAANPRARDEIVRRLQARNINPALLA